MSDNISLAAPTMPEPSRLTGRGHRRGIAGHPPMPPLTAGWPVLPLTAGSTAPPRSSQIRRSRLLSALHTPAAMTVLRAPAGFGKSTLLRHWCDGRPDAVWVTVPPGGDAGTWWSSVIDALSAAGRPAPLPESLESPRVVASRMLAAAGSVTLLVDDLDAVAGPAPDELLGLLRSHPGLRVILAGRGPAWLSDDLLADIGASTIRADQLRFTRQETADLLARSLPYLGPQVSHWTDQVHRATGGWPSVAAAVVRRMATAVPDPMELSAVATRTATEHLRRQLIPELEWAGAMDLALATAVEDTFDAAAAAAVSGCARAGSVLDRLVARGLLIGETIGGHTDYRWPRAARRVLNEELAGRDTQRMPAWHAAWARHYFGLRRPHDAVPHALAARDWPLLVSIIDGAWRALLRDDGHVLRDALTQVPVDVVSRSPRARALREIVLPDPGPTPNSVPATGGLSLPGLSAPAGRLRLATAEQLIEMLDTALLVIAAHRRHGRHRATLQHARRLLEFTTLARDARPAVIAQYLPSVQLAVGVGLLLTDDVAAALIALEQAYCLASGQGRGELFVAASTAGLLALLHAVRGEPRTATRWLAQLDRSGDSPASRGGMAHVQVASCAARLLVAVDESDHGSADAAFERLSLLNPANRWLDLWAFACYAEAQYALHRGDVHAALDRIGRASATHAHDLAEDGIAARLLPPIQANLLLAADRPIWAKHCLHRLSADGLERVPAARLALLSGNVEEAVRLSADRAWEATASTRDRIEMRLIRALAAHRAGDLPTATASLQRAARAARNAGIRSPWATVARAELRELAAQLPEASPAPSEVDLAGQHEVFPRSVELIELTEREQDVLSHLASGATVEQTASALTISYNTAKTHVHSIYRKLRVDSRQDAVAHARRLGLLGAPGH